MSVHCYLCTRRFGARAAGTAVIGLMIGAGIIAIPDAAARSDAVAQQATPEERGEAAEEVREATEAWNRLMGTPDAAVPPSILAKAKAIGIFGNVVQAAFIAGGRGGDGVITARNDGAWGAPAFFRLGGASIGAQIGARRGDIVLVFTSQKALDALLDDRLEFGAEVKAVAGPDSATAASAAATTADDGLLIYTRERGLFAGAALQGAVITPNNDLNRATFNAPAREILTKPGAITPPSVTQPLIDALMKYAAGRS